VDLGSGAGLDLLLAARRVGPEGKVIGVDMTDDMLARARDTVTKAGLSHLIDVRKGLIEDLPIASGTVDWVISNCVINLSPEKDRVFAEIARVLKPGGAMLVSDIVADNVPAWFRNIPGMLEGCVGGAIGEDEYLAGLRKAGLEAVEVRGRLVYDAKDAVAFLADEIPLLKAFTPLPAWAQSALQGIVDSTGAKVQSIRVYARKA
jgi:SAM-dependent methyltransferase